MGVHLLFSCFHYARNADLTRPSRKTVPVNCFSTPLFNVRGIVKQDGQLDAAMPVLRKSWSRRVSGVEG